jgi:hypothetical protein
VALADKTPKDEAGMAPSATAPKGDEIIQSKRALSGPKMNGSTYYEEKNVELHGESLIQTMSGMY